MDRRGRIAILCSSIGASTPSTIIKEKLAMDPTMRHVARSLRSVQQAVMSAPTTTIAEAAEASRRATRAASATVTTVLRTGLAASSSAA